MIERVTPDYTAENPLTWSPGITVGRGGLYYIHDNIYNLPCLVGAMGGCMMESCRGLTLSQASDPLYSGDP